MLVIEDHVTAVEDPAREARRVVGGRGHDGAEAGEAPRDVGRQAPYDLVLLDMQMSGMDGVDVARAIRQTHPPERLPIVILTSLGRRDTSIRLHRDRGLSHEAGQGGATPRRARAGVQRPGGLDRSSDGQVAVRQDDGRARNRFASCSPKTTW